MLSAFEVLMSKADAKKKTPQISTLSLPSLKKRKVEETVDTLRKIAKAAKIVKDFSPVDAEFQSICNIGTGFSDAQLQELSSSLCSKVIATPKIIQQYYRVDDGLNPDVWFEPTEIWEVKAADLTISPVHRAAIGIVDPDKIAEMYQAQKHDQPSNRGKGDDV